MCMSISRSRDWVRRVKLKTLKDVRNIASLIDKNSMVGEITMNLETHIIIHRPVSDFEHAEKMLDNRIEILSVCSTNDAIIHVYADNEVDGVICSRTIVYTGISIAGEEIIQFEKRVKSVVPKSARLLETVETFQVQTHIRRCKRINEPFRLVHVNPSGKVAIKIGCPDIKLAHVHSEDGSNSEDNPNRIMLDNRAKGFVIYMP